MATADRVSDRLLANVAQIGSDFVGQHFFEAKPKKVRGVAAVWPSDDVAANPSRSPGTAMTCGATVGKAGADRIVRADRAYAIAFISSLSLDAGKLALKKLPPTADRAKRVAP